MPTRSTLWLLTLLLLSPCIGPDGARADTVVQLTTIQSPIDGVSDNRGWWSATDSNSAPNITYLIGQIGANAYRAFFTFDASLVPSSVGPLVSAVLTVKRYSSGLQNETTESVAFYDVTTPVLTLNNTVGASAAIYDDLGSGGLYGSFQVAGEGLGTDVVAFPLKSLAIAAIEAAAAQNTYFSIGASLVSQDGNDYLFGQSFVGPPHPTLTLTFADPPVCGDGVVAGAEQCDDGNFVPFDGCDYCVIESGWTCNGSPSACEAICGDGIITGSESCDDGDATSGDGCSSACQVEPDWICSGAPSACAPIVCGDGSIEGSEECDDGNSAPGDGCDASCVVEADWTCLGEPSECRDLTAYVPPSEFGKVYWTVLIGKTASRANADGMNVEPVVSIGSPTGVAVNLSAGALYWTDQIAGVIRTAELDGFNPQVLLAGLNVPAGIALDEGSGQLYWVEAGRVARAGTDGSNPETLVTGLTGVGGIVLDLAGGKMYWADNASQKIQRANLDGSAVEDLVTLPPATFPSDVAVDVATGKLYWTEYGGDRIARSELDGSNVQTFVPGLAAPLGLVLDRLSGRLVFSEYDLDRIRQVKLDGSEPTDLVTAAGDGPGLIALVRSPAAVPAVDGPGLFALAAALTVAASLQLRRRR